jgi:hypothetical protein
VTILPHEAGRAHRQRRCAWCRRPLPPDPRGAGRPRRYCRRSCRQRAYEARSRAAELGLADGELAAARAAHDGLLDRLDLLRRTLDDLAADAAAGDLDDPEALRFALAILVAAAREALDDPA